MRLDLCCGPRIVFTPTPLSMFCQNRVHYHTVVKVLGFIIFYILFFYSLIAVRYRVLIVVKKGTHTANDTLGVTADCVNKYVASVP